MTHVFNIKNVALFLKREKLINFYEVVTNFDNIKTVFDKVSVS